MLREDLFSEVCCLFVSPAVTTLAGSGAIGFRDGASLQAMFNDPIGVSADAAGNVLVAELFNNRIRLVMPTGGMCFADSSS